MRESVVNGKVDKVIINSKPTILTYFRYSSSIQKDGLSEYRQEDIIKRNVIDFCEAKGVSLDDVIALSDKGVSAYRGKNLTEGSLSQIINKFQTGELPKTYDENGEINTYLFIESIDRLTRLDLPTATKIFLTIVEYCNIVVVSDNERKTYTYQRLKEQSGMFDLFQALMVISRSHNESAMKEARHRANWSKKRKDVKDYFDLSEEERKGLPYPKNLTSQCPWFLKPKSDNCGFEFIEENKEVLVYFLDRLRDGFGFMSTIKAIHIEIEKGNLKPSLTKRQEKASGFSFRTFNQLFKDGNETLVGNLVVHETYFVTDEDVAKKVYEPSMLGKKIRIPVFTVKGYYPAVISEDEFRAFKRDIGIRTKQSFKPNKKVKNIAQGISRCAICGGSMLFKPDNRESRKDNLICYNSKRGQCRSFVFNYNTFENNFLKYCRSINIAKIIGFNNSEDNKAKEMKLKAQISKYTFRISEIEDELELIVSNLTKVRIDALIEKLQNKYVSKENELKELNAILVDCEDELAELYKAISTNENVDEYLSELLDKVIDSNDIVIRERLNIDLRSVISSMKIYHETNPENILKRKMATVTFRDGYTRIIPIDKVLEDGDMYSIPPIIELKELEEIPDQLILPFDYFDGKEEGRYPEVAFMPKFYQENPALYNQIRSEIETADKLMKVVN